VIEKVYNKENLIKAFGAVKRNKGSFGIDRISIEKYETSLNNNLDKVQRLLVEEKYKPQPVKKVLIPKANGKLRPLGIPTVEDRIVQQSLLEAIQPIFENIFSNNSYGFRPNKSAIQAINKVQEYLDEGYEYIVEADIRDFFGQLSQQRLICKVKEQIKERPILNLVWKFLKAGVMEDGKVKKAISGTPQGGVISPLLANVYLNDFDHKIERGGFKLVRYADDFVIMCKTVNQATASMKMVRSLMSSMKLELAEEKTKIVEYKKGFDFLGYHFQKSYGKRLRRPTTKAINAFKDKIRHKTRRQQPKNVAMIVKEITPIIRGWGNYFRYGNNQTRFENLDAWTRMRLRSFIRKKKWPSGLNWMYPNDHFEKLGLISLTNLLKYQQKISFPT
jgi:RNA-directed DNA polymerase